MYYKHSHVAWVPHSHVMYITHWKSSLDRGLWIWYLINKLAVFEVLLTMHHKIFPFHNKGWFNSARNLSWKYYCVNSQIFNSIKRLSRSFIYLWISLLNNDNQCQFSHLFWTVTLIHSDNNSQTSRFVRFWESQAISNFCSTTQMEKEQKTRFQSERVPDIRRVFM